MTLQVGTSAPHFRAETLDGASLDLHEYTGKTVLLSFFRNAACALCNLRVHHLITRAPAYARQGLSIIAVFESSVDAMRAYVGRQQAPFPLIADPGARLYDLYGVETSEEKVATTMGRPETQLVVHEATAYGFPLIPEPGSNVYRMPADFLIGPDGVLLQAHYTTRVTDHLPFAVIEQHL